MAKKKKSKVKKQPNVKKDSVVQDKPKKGAEVKKKRVGPFRFFKDVRSEVSKVTWPTRKETTSATLMVFLMVVAVAFFFFFVDKILSASIRAILGFGA